MAVPRSNASARCVIRLSGMVRRAPGLAAPNSMLQARRPARQRLRRREEVGPRIAAGRLLPGLAGLEMEVSAAVELLELLPRDRNRERRMGPRAHGVRG